MDEQKIIDMYVKDRMTLRSIAKKFDTDHHRIKRILTKHGIEITQKDRVHAPFTEEHKRKISEASKGRTRWCKGKTMSREAVIKNMVNHIKYNVDASFYEQFKDIDKLKCLNHMLTRSRVSKYFDDDKYKKFICKFYHDNQFNKVYAMWKKNNDKWSKPSLDHIVAISRGGTYELSNFQILTWFENRAKCEMNDDEWQLFKRKTGTQSEYFV